MPTSAELVEQALAAIAANESRTNAVIFVDSEHARARAREMDDERKRGIDRGPLHGMPISLKDLIDVAGQPTTAGSKVRAAHVASHDAPIVTRLRDAGAVIIGKTNLHEFALGPTSDESAFGPVRNPYDEARVAGGSSGGSAVAVALGMSIASIGSDTGGSIRIPAAACGVVGLKPSLGEVPTQGVVPLSGTLDHVGPLTRTVADAANVWAILAGRPIPQLEPRERSTLRFASLGGYFTSLLSDEVRAAYDRALERLCGAGVSITPTDIEETSSIVPTYADISLPEAAHWHGPTLATQAQDYQPIVRSRLQHGREIPAVNYLAALEKRERYRALVDQALAEYDALILPTLPIVAPPVGAADVIFPGSSEPFPVRPALLRLTQLFNITGHPAISLPIVSTGLPVGVQLVGRRGQTKALLDVSASVEHLLGQA